MAVSISNTPIKGKSKVGPPPLLRHAGALRRAVSLVRDRIGYIDTAACWLSRPVTRDELRAIKAACGGRVWAEFGPMRRQPKWVCKLVLQLPGDQAFAYIEALPGDAMLNQAHLALDIVTDTPEDARTLEQFFAKHVVKMWHGRQQVDVWDNTMYSAKVRGKWVGHRLVTYADRPSKVTGMPACHLEWRSMGVQACRSIGVRKPADMVGFDHRRHWQHRGLVLRDYDAELLGLRALRVRGKRRAALPRSKQYRKNIYVAAGHLLARMTERDDEQGRPVRPPGATQLLLDNFAQHAPWMIRRDVQLALINIDNSMFLPD